MIILAAGFLNTLLKWDLSLFRFMNNDLSNPLFDAVMPFMRNANHWLPLYLFLLVFVFLNFKVKGVWWVVFFLVTVALCDMIGTRGFKYTFERTRPCNNPDLIGHLRLLVNCPSGWGFTSNHAANHFGMATFIFISFRKFIGRWALLAFLWAGTIAFAQVYVGVHYPGDIAGGALLGCIVGLFTGTQFNKYFRLDLPSSLPAH
ncbi:MAG: phosphatase PAP2 family protein [Chitinophagaceae bacterium]